MSRHPARTGEKTFFGHPFQLSTLFHIELWERFSFYGMQGILLIYLYYTADKGGLGIAKPSQAALSAHTAAACTCPPFWARGLPTAYGVRKKPSSSRASS